MKRQMKIAAVVSATALLAIGASFTSMAAAKTGTWKLEDEGWVCYDKDGDLYENEFCLDGGKEYYVGDDGVLVTNDWVETEDGLFYVGSTGAKTINDWRYLVPDEGEEDDDAEWFYFSNKGTVATGKKVIDGNTYYFNEDGVMLTGWVDYDAEDKKATEATTSSKDMIYTDENGARVASAWIKTYAPEADEDDIEAEDVDAYWYWIKGSGKPQTGRNLDINGSTYYFNNDGKMLSGWVVGYDNDSSKDGKADEFATSSNAFGDADAVAVYFCGGEDQGWSKKNTWVKTYAPEDFEANDADNETYWYWINKNGEVLRADAEASDANAMKFVDGEAGKVIDVVNKDGDVVMNKIVEKEINGKTYGFKNNGQMWSGLVKVEGIGVKYYGKSNDGAMKTGSVMVADADEYEYKFFFAENDKYEFKKGAAVTGNADGDLYENGQLVTTDDKYAKKTVTIDGKKYTFVIDSDGDIRTSKKHYKDEDEKTVENAAAEGHKGFLTNVKGFTKGSLK